jgi:hypothetical protein
MANLYRVHVLYHRDSLKTELTAFVLCDTEGEAITSVLAQEGVADQMATVNVGGCSQQFILLHPTVERVSDKDGWWRFDNGNPSKQGSGKPSYVPRPRSGM